MGSSSSSLSSSSSHRHYSRRRTSKRVLSTDSNLPPPPPYETFSPVVHPNNAGPVHSQRATCHSDFSTEIQNALELLTKVKTVFIVDDSSSMQGERWQEVRNITSPIIAVVNLTVSVLGKERDCNSHTDG
jgi:hypothetical protein